MPLHSPFFFLWACACNTEAMLDVIIPVNHGHHHVLPNIPSASHVARRWYHLWSLTLWRDGQHAHAQHTPPHKCHMTLLRASCASRIMTADIACSRWCCPEANSNTPHKCKPGDDARNYNNDDDVLESSLLVVDLYLSTSLL